MFAPVIVSRHIAPMIEGKNKTMRRQGGAGGKASAAESDHLELLADMGVDFASSLDIKETIAKALNRIIAHLDAEGGALFLLDEAGGTLRCHASVGGTDITGLTLKSDQGIVGRSVQSNKGEIVRDARTDPNFQKSVDEQTGFTTRSILCAPMSVKDQRLGAIEMVNKRGGDGLFDDDDLRLLQVLSTSAALAVLNARMAEALVEQERVKRELELAAEIQRSLLPECRDAAFPVHGVNIPARTVSGDFFDFFPLDDGRICFNLGDVSGKGMNAALLMAKTASLFRCLGKTIHEPGRLLALINDEVCETATRGMFVTMIGGVYDPATGVVRLANAGHEPPLFRDRDGSFSDLPAEAPPLGISPLLVEGVGFPETEIRLDGGTLYIFTDGLTEGYLENGESLEVAGLKALIEEYDALTAPERIHKVLGHLYRDNVVLRDDLTFMTIEDNENRRDTALKPGAAPDNGAGETLLKIHFPSIPDRLKLVRAAVRKTVEFCGCDSGVVQDVVIAVDEACQNVIRHAYGGDEAGEIELEITRVNGDLVLYLRDYADPIDISKVKPRDLDDLRPGGLGTHFINEVMDEVEFMPSPTDGGNLLKMLKHIGARPETGREVG